MRLAAFKARGFKSFADPVAFKVTEELTGVVGPNGCGKSNIVDAVRWALGESRASSLRGTALSDVMFNGSETRHPADRCEVELRFDNSEGRASGVWSAYSDIVVRRELSRDGRQGYAINGTGVRRRDVVDLFRGTGVAPRAYGIVEQGMVTEIAESSPEELRAFMEEAAGVSHYKERRRDGERRLQAAEENLAQLELVMDGVVRRAESLKRQARTARRYRELGEEINRLEALLILSRRAAAERELEEVRERLRGREEEVGVLQNKLDRLRADEECGKTRRAEMQAQVDAALSELGAAQKAAAAADNAMQNAVSGKNAAQTRLREVRRDQEGLAAQMKQLEAEEEALRGRLEELREELRQEEGVAEAEAGELAELQEGCARAQAEGDEARVQLTEAQRRMESESVRGQMQAQRVADVDKRREAVRMALEALSAEEVVAPETAGEEAALSAAEDALAAVRERLGTHVAAGDEADAAARRLENDIARLTAEINTLNAMLKEDGWGEADHRLAHVLQVDAGEWARALDAALGSYAAAVAVDSIGEAMAQAGLPPPGGALVEMRPDAVDHGANETGLPPLLEKVRAPAAGRVMLAYWLADVFAAEEAAQAAAVRGRLRRGQRVVTRAGEVFGRYSLLATGETRGGYDWENRMRALLAEQAEKTAALEAQAAVRARAREAAGEARRAAAAAAGEVERARQALADKRIEMHRAAERRAAAADRRAELGRSLAELDGEREELKRLQAESATAGTRLREEYEERVAVFERLKTRLEEAGAALESCRERGREAEMKRREDEREMEEAARRMGECENRRRDNGERRRLLERRALEFSREAASCDEEAMRQVLADCRARLQEGEAQLAARREELAAAEGEQARGEIMREEVQSDREALRRQMGDERVKEREAVMKVGYLNDALEELALAAEPEPPREGDAETWREKIAQLRAKRERLGAINFMADSELRECENRVAHAQAQKTDADEAIAELRAAIRRIDGETRTRLQAMFENVNREFPLMYRRIFDGGEARLEMTGESILEAGFELKVRPPGKRLFPVRMLSGGEKAASAAAFVFAILRLNPPPFCLLDEVDAPLDDSRSRRFCELLADISQDVQCLVVTHNKNTIAFMPRLIGVTQEEAGVSKVVAVTLADALRNAG